MVGRTLSSTLLLLYRIIHTSNITHNKSHITYDIFFETRMCGAFTALITNLISYHSIQITNNTVLITYHISYITNHSCVNTTLASKKGDQKWCLKRGPQIVSQNTVKSLHLKKGGSNVAQKAS